ncbi:PilW family protein [Undibacterium squillarum]|uniref:PilW family protein n=1 Tax=Undibacterium squillarum TaxID=1131567 RepID=UPI0035B1D4D0
MIRRPLNKRSGGFSLIELMIGLAIGLAVVLISTSLYVSFIQSRERNSGVTNAQTSGNISLYLIQRRVANAAFGLPLQNKNNPAMRCAVGTGLDHDNNPATDPIDYFPVSIIDGANGASDTLIVHQGDSDTGGIPARINSMAANTLTLNSNFGCKNGDVVMISNGSACSMTKVTNVPAGNNTDIVTAAATNAAIGASVACMGNFTEFRFATTALQKLTENQREIASDVVSLQAQYGLANDVNSNQITSWVNASGNDWSYTATTPTLANRNRIRAIRVALIVRSGQAEREEIPEVVSCSSLTAAKPSGICAWAGTAADPSPLMNLALQDPDWRRYRYRVFETIIPLRNVIWARGNL